MKLLALDTSSDACSVALQCDDIVLERHLLRPKEHTRLLMPMLQQVLEEAGIGIRELDAIVAGVGPGSFIGVRIAVSVAQGLAFAGERPVVPVSSLAAVAAESFDNGTAERVIVAQDARRQEVYLACFERAAAGVPRAIGDAVLQRIAPIERLAGEAGAGWHAAGAGWRRYPELLSLNRHALAGQLEVELPRARFLLATAGAACERGATIDPEDLAPAYVRLQVARPPDGH